MTTWHLDLYAEPDGLFLAALDDGGALLWIERVYNRASGDALLPPEPALRQYVECAFEYALARAARQGGEPDAISSDASDTFARFASLFAKPQYVRDGRSNAWVERHLRAALGCKLKTASTRESVARNGALISAFFWGSAVFVGAIWSTVAWVVLA